MYLFLDGCPARQTSPAKTREAAGEASQLAVAAHEELTKVTWSAEVTWKIDENSRLMDVYSPKIDGEWMSNHTQIW